MNRQQATQLARAQARPRLGGQPARSGFHRYELKFRLPIEIRRELRRALSAHVQPDPHALDRPGNCYTVRSIYFDSEELVFYHEKLESVSIRKKLRIRGYDRPEDDAPIFFEIKRKNGKRGYKERLSLPASQMMPALVGGAGISDTLPFAQRRVIQRFRYNVERKRLRPVVLVAYEREPMIGIENERVRVTFDMNIRSLINPRLEELFDEGPLRQFEDRCFILEMKFDERMPRWMAGLMRDFDIRPHSYSKFCHGIDAWTPHPE